MYRTSLLFLAALPAALFAQTSPNGKISAEYYASRQAIIVSYHTPAGQTQEVLALHTPSPVSCSSPGAQSTVHEVAYDLPTGKKSHYTNAYVEGSYALANARPLTLRLYNDGVAWSGAHDYQISIAEAKNHWIQQWGEAYEDFFPQNRTIREGERYGYPALFEYPGDVFALISESDVNKWTAGSCLYGTADPTRFLILPEGQQNGGWQTMMIGSLADVVESTLIADNSTPCKLDDTSWIEPGVASWIYWANNHGSNDMRIIRQYVDMAVELHLPYVLIDAEWDEMDRIPENNGATIEDAVRYATDRGIKPLIWYSSSIGWIDGAPGPKFRLNDPALREREFAWLESIGIKGIKVDFFSGDSYFNIWLMVELLESAARHHLTVNFHGATIPRGWQRTYPNLVSTEAVYGAEWYNNKATLTNKAACHNATLPFTRNVIGPMDYTPCAFSDSQHPHITTHAHELALTALYESAVQHLADRPESFLAQPDEVKAYLGSLPTAWDETHLLSGYPGRSCVMARRKGAKWYIAGINGLDAPQTLAVPTEALGLKADKKHPLSLLLFEDSAEADGTKKPIEVEHPWQISRPKAVPSELKCQPRGGFVLVVE